MQIWTIIKHLFRPFLYSVYRYRLEKQVDNWKIPEHIGIILDGNRRYAKESGFVNVVRGHYDGADKLEEFLGWCEELGVKIVSIWIFSLDNFNRDGSEVRDILNVIEEKMQEMIHSDKVHHNQVHIRSMGKIDLLPASLQETIRKAEAITKNYDKFILNVAVAYGGREEVVEAFRNYLISQNEKNKPIGDLIEEIDVTSITEHLYTSDLPDPDLIIRTSGEIRLSGFLMWQSVYAEYYFCDTFWPAFRKIDFLRAIRDYNKRHRRFGR